MIPDTVAALLEMIDRPRRELGRLEDALARAGWQWCERVSATVDNLVLEIEDLAR